MEELNEMDNILEEAIETKTEVQPFVAFRDESHSSDADDNPMEF